MGSFPYFPEIIILGKILVVWVDIIRHNLVCNVNRAYIKIFSEAYGFSTYLGGTLMESINFNIFPKINKIPQRK